MSLHYDIRTVYNVFTLVIATKKIAFKEKMKKINASRLCPKSTTEMKTFQKRMKIKVKTNENRRVSDLSKTRQKDENVPNAVEKHSKNE